MDKLSDWIKIYDDMISDDLAERLVSLHENNQNNLEYQKESYRRCQIYTGMVNKPIYQEFKNKMRDVLLRYKQEIGNTNLHHLKCLETPNIIRYIPNDPDGKNYFHPHSDTWCMRTASRQLSIILYLNDVEEGGGTTFTDLNMTVQPKKGRLLVFPSFYTFTHQGEAPISGPKYIVVSWIHFGGKGHAFPVQPLFS